jgi:hypothetical protein
MIAAIRGTHDILPGDVEKWQYVERVARELCERYGYLEIRTPIIEREELFSKGTGETTDIVQKEMYAFTDKGGERVTLRPEATPSMVRAYIEHNLEHTMASPKLFAKTLGDTGCGFYPNSSFVHIDVRDAGAGHVTWIDASGPGETPRYVPTWPPPAPEHLHRASATHRSTEDLAEEGASLLRARRPSEQPSDREDGEAIDEHPAAPETEK